MFSHGLQPDESFSYQGILDEGTVLLNALQVLQRDAMVSFEPARKVVPDIRYSRVSTGPISTTFVIRLP